MYYIGLLSNVALTAGQELELRHVGSNVLSGYVVSLVRGPGVTPKPRDVTPSLKRTATDSSVLGEAHDPCLVPPILPKFHYAKRRFSVTLKCRQMHGVLNIDEIKTNCTVLLYFARRTF
jgi:hypothetical protein